MATWYRCVDRPHRTIGTKGDTGATGATGAGVVVGGTTGQILTKNSSTDYDTTAGRTPANSH